ncbi:hypothetical protein D5952_14140 [Salmonella enterica subsp. enterica]|nr:hypothetical protein [Salmonella enterica subsp. enterica serovar Bonn]EBZ5939321.1 hypothetical protein [Salmonella enterica subsp. enterica serovar Muenchen]MLZ41064.1 hypothetical protein [Salmonella enterica subsp. enterica serovar Bonn]
MFSIVGQYKDKLFEGRDDCYTNVARFLTSVCQYHENSTRQFAMKCKIETGEHSGSRISVNVDDSAINVMIVLCNYSVEAEKNIINEAEHILKKNFDKINIMIDEA